jgi:CBS domain-containing protein
VNGTSAATAAPMVTTAYDLMSSPVFVVSVKDSLSRARNLMLSNGVSRLCVMDGDRLAGVITKKDLAARLNQSEPRWRRRPLDQVPVSLIMTPDPMTILPGTPVRDIATMMIEHDVSGFPVFDESLQGIVTRMDLVKYFTAVGCPLTVGDMMARRTVTVSRHNTVNSVIDLMTDEGVSNVIVSDASARELYVGVITLDDLGFVLMDPSATQDITQIRKESCGGQKKYRHVRRALLIAEDIMASPIISVNEAMPAVEAARIMVENDIDLLPVIDGSLAGQFTREAIIKWLSEVPE